MKPWIVPLLRWYYNDYDDTDNNADDNTVTMITGRKYVESELSTFSGEEMKTWSIVTSR